MNTPSAPFPFDDFRAAREALLSAIDGDDHYVLLVGESGGGKTTVLRDLRAQLDRHHLRVIYFNLARLSPAGLVRVLARQLRIPPSRSQPETIQAIAKVLLEEPTRTWLWIDEAQMLPDETFAELRTLAETSLEGELALSMLLVGLLDLRERLQAPRLFPIWRRVETCVQITGIRSDEARAFVTHIAAKKEADRFDDGGLSLLFERSRGLPALMTTFTRRVLRAVPAGPIDAATVERVLSRWEGE